MQRTWLDRVRGRATHGSDRLAMNRSDALVSHVSLPRKRAVRVRTAGLSKIALLSAELVLPDKVGPELQLQVRDELKAVTQLRRNGSDKNATSHERLQFLPTKSNRALFRLRRTVYQWRKGIMTGP